MTKHFSTGDWIDFARAVPNESNPAMQRHLNDGCSECSANLAAWTRVNEVVKLQKTFEPPDWAIRAVNTSFALQKISSLTAGKFELANLLFDSAIQPVLAGVRGSAPAVRQLLYKSGSVCIDMRMQSKAGSNSMVLMGQLLDSAKPDRGISGIPVSLLSDRGTISRNKTNEVGEFVFGIDTLNHMQLVFGMGESRTIVVPLPSTDASRDLT